MGRGATNQSSRLASIDVFRGLTIALMILVGFPGSWDHVYRQLDHAPWLGWTLTDLVFPWFLFICGISMVFSFAKRRELSPKTSSLHKHIIVRSILIVFIGLLINFFPDFTFSTLRFPGVLQRLGIVYLIVGMIYLHTNDRTQIGISVFILLAYWALLTLMPVPGFALGDLSPEGNLVGWMDRTLMGIHARTPTDPEGLLSTIPSIVNMLAGCMVGQWLRRQRDKSNIVGWLYFSGWVLIIGGLFWGNWFPISKKLWTSSYVIFTTGTAFHLLAVCYWLIEIKGYSRWTKPAIIYGSNAMLVYILHIFEIRLLNKALTYTRPDGSVSTAYTWIWEHAFVPWAGTWGGSLVFAIFHVLFWLAIMTVFYRRKIWVKI